jgi:hypothetical protein
MSRQTKKRPKARTFLVLALVLYLLSNAFLNVIVMLSGNKITMDYNDHRQQEKEISSVIPVGTDVPHAKRIMWMNGFACSKQTSTLLEFEKNDGWFPTYEGTAWIVETRLKNGQTSATKVWIEPND